MRTPVHIRGADGKMKLQQQGDPARKERQERLTALTRSPEWELVMRGLNQRRQSLVSRMMTGRQMEDWETRSCREQYALLTLLANNPVVFLLEFDARQPVAVDEPSDDKGE